MSTFDEREKQFERKFQHDQEIQFKVNVRRNKLLGLWAAGQLGLSGDKAEAYAKDVVAADFSKAGTDDVVLKIKKDLAAKGVDLTEHRIRAEMESLTRTAKEQIAKG
jgi:hypothetical protein